MQTIHELYTHMNYKDIYYTKTNENYNYGDLRAKNSYT